MLVGGGLSCSSSERLQERKREDDPRAAVEPEPPQEPLTFSVDAPYPSWVERTLESLTLEEKVGQMVMARAFGHYISASSDEYQRLVRLVEEMKIGGIAAFQADVYEQAVLLNKLQRLARVPLLVAADYERGLAMRVRRGTYFPDAMAIGATRNPDYAYRIGRAIAREARAIGVHQNFAPVADVNNNPANPVINTRSFGEDVNLVNRMVEGYARGLNDGGVVSTAKHFPGHGDTGVDSHIDLPLLSFDRRRLDSLELVPFKYAVEHGVMSVMVAHLDVPSIDAERGVPATLSSSLVTGVLRKEMGFQGLIVTDAMEMRGLVRGFATAEASVRAVKAGVDILLMPVDEQAAIEAVVHAVRRGEIPEERINESVTRILMVKQWLLLDEERLVDIDHIADVVGTKEHWMLAREVARNAITVVKNDGGLLPLRQYGKKKLLAVFISDVEDNRTDVNRPGQQLTNEPFSAYFSQQLRRRYGSVESVRLSSSSNQMDFDSALSKMRRADIVLLPLYVKVRSSFGSSGLPKNMTGFIQKVGEVKKPVVAMSFGNPYVLSNFSGASAMMCAYSDAEVMVEAAVEGLFGEIDVRGRLPVTIPGLFPYGSGLQFARTELRSDDPAVAGFDPEKLSAVDSLVVAAIYDSAFPAAQVTVVKDGIIAYNKSFGTYTYDRTAQSIDGSTLFDIASLTKVVGTTAAAMKLYDQQKFGLDDPVQKYLPQFTGNLKERVTIRHLLNHTSGLPPFRRLWGVTKSPAEALDSVYTTRLVATPGDTTIYSDLGMILLGKVVETLSGMQLDSYLRQEFYDPLKMINTTFKPSRAIWPQVAPTELDTVWRGELVQGRVHDENAAALGGVAGHAGLFSTASDLSIFMQMLMNKGTYGGTRYLSDTTVSLFTRRQSTTSTRALGWDTKSATNSSAGDVFSSSSFGHLGFTGTSIWADPERKLFVVFLTNRVHPTRANGKIFKIRPVLHDAVINALKTDKR